MFWYNSLDKVLHKKDSIIQTYLLTYLLGWLVGWLGSQSIS